MNTKHASPFRAGSDHTNACVNYSRDMTCGYTEGYRLGAQLLTDHVESTNRDHDFLVYPICYLYRHHLELQIKQIIRVGRPLFGRPGTHPKHHKLTELWTLAKDLLREAEPHQNDPVEFKQIDEFITELATIDCDAQAFRFPTKTNGKGRSLDGVTHISLTTLRDTVEPLASFLWGCESWLAELRQFQYEMDKSTGSTNMLPNGTLC